MGGARTSFADGTLPLTIFSDCFFPLCLHVFLLAPEWARRSASFVLTLADIAAQNPEPQYMVGGPYLSSQSIFYSVLFIFPGQPGSVYHSTVPLR